MSTLANAVRENLPKDMMQNWGQWMKRYFKYCRRSWHCISKARSIHAHTKHKQSKGRRNDVNSFRTRFEARKFISKLMTQHRVGAETILMYGQKWTGSIPDPGLWPCAQMQFYSIDSGYDSSRISGANSSRWGTKLKIFSPTRHCFLCDPQSPHSFITLNVWFPRLGGVNLEKAGGKRKI